MRLVLFLIFFIVIGIGCYYFYSGQVYTGVLWLVISFLYFLLVGAINMLIDDDEYGSP